MDLGGGVLVAIAIVVGLLIVLVALSVRVVPQWANMVVYRWGQAGPNLVRTAGLRFLIPVADKGYIVDLREQFIEVPRQTAITKDNAPLGVDFLIYWKIVDPLMSQINVLNFAGALQGVAATSLRSVIGDIPLDDVLSQREKINDTLRTQAR
jgi:regulator of protease activity HflC (stomatin/prohibitin superfamily)